MPGLSQRGAGLFPFSFWRKRPNWGLACVSTVFHGPVAATGCSALALSDHAADVAARPLFACLAGIRGVWGGRAPCRRPRSRVARTRLGNPRAAATCRGGGPAVVSGRRQQQAGGALDGRCLHDGRCGMLCPRPNAEHGEGCPVRHLPLSKWLHVAPNVLCRPLGSEWRRRWHVGRGGYASWYQSGSPRHCLGCRANQAPDAWLSDQGGVGAWGTAALSAAFAPWWLDRRYREISFRPPLDPNRNSL